MNILSKSSLIQTTSIRCRCQTNTITTNGLYAELLVVVESEAVAIEVRPLADLAGARRGRELHDIPACCLPPLQHELRALLHR